MMSERLYGVVAFILLIAIISGVVFLRINDQKLQKILAPYPTGNMQTDKQLNDSITSAMITGASFSRTNSALAKKTDANGWTPLHWAAAGDHMSIVKVLLSQRVDVNAQDKNGWTPLHWAASKGYADVVKLLLARNADVSIQDAIGMTPFKLAEQSGQKETADLISQHGGMD